MKSLALITWLLFAASPSPSLIWTEQGADDSACDIVAARPGSRRVLGTLPVAAGYEPRSDLAADGASLALISLEDPRSPDRAASLWKQPLDGMPRERVAIGLSFQAPLALSGGDVVAVETLATRTPPPEATRRGELESVTAAVRLFTATGRDRTLATFEGYGIHLAGRVSRGVLVYRVAGNEAAFYLVSINAPAAPKRLAAAPDGPFARDFSVRGDELVFASSSSRSSGFTVWTLDTRTGEMRALVQAGSAPPSPLSAGGELFFVRSAGLGHELLSLASGGTRIRLASRGDLRPLAGDSAGKRLVFSRQLGASRQLFWLDHAASEPKRLETKRFFSVAGFAELP